MNRDTGYMLKELETEKNASWNSNRPKEIQIQDLETH